MAVINFCQEAAASRRQGGALPRCPRVPHPGDGARGDASLLFPHGLHDGVNCLCVVSHCAEGQTQRQAPGSLRSQTFCPGITLVTHLGDSPW